MRLDAAIAELGSLGRMSRILPILALSFLIVGCKPKWSDYAKEHERVYQVYLTGDVASARAALFEEEKIIAKHEARGTRMDAKAARRVLYGRLCAVSSHMGLTNDAHVYFEKVVALKENTNAVTMAELLAGMERSDQEMQPKWRQQK
jgi:hypothetical protein